MWLYDLLLCLDLKGLFIGLFLVLLVADFFKNRNPANYPPGPLGLPFVGVFFNVDLKHPHLYFNKLSEEFGNVFSVRMGRDKAVFVTGYKMIKEALVTQADNFVDRPLKPVADKLYPGSGGMFMSNGGTWKKHRSFALSTLRTFGLGTNTLEKSIQEEINHLQRVIENQKGEPFSTARLLDHAVSNIICQMVMRKRFEYNDSKFQNVLKSMSDLLMLEGSMWARLYESFPNVMKHLPGPHNKIFANFNLVKDFVQEEVEKHKKDLDHNNPRDYIDTFLVEMAKNKESELGFNDTNLTLCSLDLFLAGTETTSTTLQWALVYLMNHPEVQEKVQAEIDTVIGHSRLPSMADRTNMPYADAVINEIQRMANIVPMKATRMAARDTTLGGYFIPKGTAIVPLMTSVMFDKSQWETPDTFNPEHFLNAKGKFVKKEAHMPFSAGKRVCPGEGLAKMEMFLFLVALLQKFSFSVPGGAKLSTEGINGASRVPHPFNVQARVR